ncbi:MAG: ATP-binding protein [Bacteroidaceae bacterium]|nr:ATP-binding protein [Bacteroidaceae bacterium]
MDLIERKPYVDKVVNYLGKGIIIVLTGQRRVGKSCILRSVAERIKAKDGDTNIIYINKEYGDFRDLRDDVQLDNYVDQHLQTDRHNVLLIDEVQDIDRFENTLRSLQAQDRCDIIITGSNAKMLSGELATYLSGRYIEVPIQGLDYREFMQFHRLPDTDDTFRRYITFGGLPQLAHIGLENTDMVRDYLSDIYNTVIMKDVISRESIRNVRFLGDLVRFVADNVGKNISANSISRFMRSQGAVVSPTLTSNYLSFLCNAYIIRQTRRFDIHGRRLFDTNEKYYFNDFGLRNSLVGVSLLRDIEKLLENAVFLHLCQQGYEVTVGQLQAGEIDFVAERGGEREYFQVCCLLSSQETIDREFGNLRKIRDDRPKTVLCMDTMYAGSTLDGIRCRHIREWLGE